MSLALNTAASQSGSLGVLTQTMVGCDQLETGHPSLEALTNQYAEMSESKQELLIDNSKFVIRNKCLQLVVLYGSLTFYECGWSFGCIGQCMRRSHSPLFHDISSWNRVTIAHLHTCQQGKPVNRTGSSDG